MNLDPKAQVIWMLRSSLPAHGGLHEEEEKVVDYVSKQVDVATGVVEGLVLGPLLFLIQILRS